MHIASNSGHPIAPFPPSLPLLPPILLIAPRSQCRVPTLLAGFCGVSKTLPLPQSIETELHLSFQDLGRTGGNATFDETVHLVAAEPHATILRIGVSDGAQEIAYETAVLGRLRRGYRVFQLRGPLGTRIEICYMFVRISFGQEAKYARPGSNPRPHGSNRCCILPTVSFFRSQCASLWPTPRQLRIARQMHTQELFRLKLEVMRLRKGTIKGFQGWDGSGPSKERRNSEPTRKSEAFDNNAADVVEDQEPQVGEETQVERTSSCETDGSRRSHRYSDMLNPEEHQNLMRKLMERDAASAASIRESESVRSPRGKFNVLSGETSPRSHRVIAGESSPTPRSRQGNVGRTPSLNV